MIAGLTGGIGCGKSTVLEIFAGLGWRVFNSDGICRSLYESHDPRIISALTERWGREIIDAAGGVNRKAVADIVFADRAELTWLNSVFHPLVLAYLRRTVRDCGGRPVLCDVPLLYEAGWARDFTAVICVWTDAATQYRRLRERGWDDREIARRRKNQLSAEQKLEQADWGIINVFSKKILLQQCQDIDIKLRKSYAEKEE
ncbi:MAG: dephospho-CoA kinase [Victivallales bacterium]|nr:dephospho-CoA kinase [Victivallales bacterium]